MTHYWNNIIFYHAVVDNILYIVNRILFTVFQELYLFNKKYVIGLPATLISYSNPIFLWNFPQILNQLEN